jgi:hypothetical protein
VAGPCRALVGLFVGDGDHFFERRDARAHLDQAGLAQVAHAFGLGLLAMSSAVPSDRMMR